MRRAVSLCIGLVFCLMLSTVALAKSITPANFPLRVHLYSHNAHSHYKNGILLWAEGEGRANLYEKGEPRAFDYSYRCDSRVMNSIGYETYLAKWKKQGKSLEIVLPVMGKPNAGETCELKVVLKESVAYYKKDGQVREKSAEGFKRWMERHQYDPEQGKDVPVQTSKAETDDGQ